MRRSLSLLLLIAALAPGTWLRDAERPPSQQQRLTLIPVKLPPPDILARHLGAFELVAAWQLRSPNRGFGGYSALIALTDGQFLAISDKGNTLHFSPPGAVQRPPFFGRVFPGEGFYKTDRDAEAATYDAATGQRWIGWETSNSITRFGPRWHFDGRISPRAMAGWGGNAGPESMVRLADGRFILLREAFNGDFETRRHEAVLFRGDPLTSGEPERFTFSGPAKFSPTDMVQLPDGRVLILLRRPVWPLPFRFAGRIAIADPAAIRSGKVWSSREVAKLTSSLPVDNFEGIAIVPRNDGRVTVWLISDDNDASTQRTLLWKMIVDPRRL